MDGHLWLGRCGNSLGGDEQVFFLLVFFGPKIQRFKVKVKKFFLVFFFCKKVAFVFFSCW